MVIEFCVSAPCSGKMFQRFEGMDYLRLQGDWIVSDGRFSDIQLLYGALTWKKTIIWRDSFVAETLFSSVRETILQGRFWPLGPRVNFCLLRYVFFGRVCQRICCFGDESFQLTVQILKYYVLSL